MKKHLSILAFFALTAIQISCSSDDKNVEPVIEPLPTETNFIRAADISFLPEIESTSTLFYNSNNQAENLLTTLKNAGCNTIRIRLWKNPSSNHSALTEVKALALRVKQAGMKVWLTVHYSDTWADPGNQTTPAEWQSLSFSDLKIAIENYTSSILTEINPDIFQIGNEINDGFLWPSVKLTTNETQFLQLLTVASAKIRSQSPSTKIMIHYAGINSGGNTGATWFFDKVKNINYDYIGLSYYPQYHGKLLSEVKSTINLLGQTHNKKVIIAETAYPHTLLWNDYTNNILGLDSQIISTYPATPEGQKNFMNTLKATIKESQYGQGFAYWGTEWVAFRGATATNGSSWENQALYDFNNKALPVMDVFNAQ